MTLKLVTAPVAQPVTLAEAKVHMRVDGADEDALVTAMIVAATDFAEQNTSRALMTQTWDLTLDAFPTAFALTRPPVQSVTSITYVDALGVTQTLAAPTYVLVQDDFGFAKIIPAFGSVWPDTQAQPACVTVRYVAGYANAAAVPEAIKSWIKLQIGAMFENREAETVQRASPVKLGFVDGLLARYKVGGL